MWLLALLFIQSLIALDPIVEPALKEWMGMRDCLPGEINQEISQWLTEVKNYRHYQFLETQGLLQLYSELRAGAQVCQAIESTLIRVMNKHAYVLAQRKSASIAIVENDGWQETLVKLKELTKHIKKRCIDKRFIQLLSREKVREVTKCMVLAEKKATARSMAYHLG